MVSRAFTPSVRAKVLLFPASIRALCVCRAIEYVDVGVGLPPFEE